VREALAARSGRDFVATGASPLASGGRRLGSAAMAALRFAIRRPALVLGFILMVAASVAVALNALAWQTGRHKSPLFARKGEPAERRPAPSPPLPPMRPAAAAAPAPTSAPAVANPPAVPLPAPKPIPSRDPIGDLIRSTETGSFAPKDAAKVMAAQRALTKLGYGELKSDGVIGPGTRQAIEKFERDRKLAVTGELSPRTLRELSARAGFPIE
jgi:pimeloyl-ACP methyl ester carboxylesterase